METVKMFDLVWIAMLKDGTNITQYNEDGTETLFKEVLDNKDKLKQFALVKRNDKTTFLVDLEKGCISLTKLGGIIQQPRKDMLRKDDYTYRLIYFREVTKHFGSNLQEIPNSEEITYFLGFQYTDENNKNQKRMMKITKKGNWIVN